MRFSLKHFVIITAFVFVGSGNLFAQANSSVWAVDFVKTKDGQQQNYLKFIENNWAKARAFMKQKGIAASYQVLSLQPLSQDAEWDVLLMTEYVSESAYEQREAIFQEYKKSIPINQSIPAGASVINARQISEIKFSRTFARPISSEIGAVMLRTQTADAETAAARVPLENYLKGHATGDPEYMKKAFYAEGKLIFVREGKYSARSFAEYIGAMNGKPAADEAQRKRWIEKVEVVGNAGVGTIILDYPNGKFTDYMTLLKIDGEWKIVNKSFYFEPKTTGGK